MSHLPIILIEDDSTIRESLQSFLEFEGFTVYAADNGRDGLGLVQKERGRCLVLLDLQMPIMPGEEMLAALSKETDPDVRDVPILVITARMEKINHSNIVGFLRKPFDLDRLLEDVTRYSKLLVN